MSELTVRSPSGTSNVPGWGLCPSAWMFGVCGRVAWSADAGSAAPTTKAKAPSSTVHRIGDWRIRDRTAPTSLWVERPKAVDVERLVGHEGPGPTRMATGRGRELLHSHSVCH